MSMRADCGVCQSCGTVQQADELTPIEEAEGWDAYLCPQCYGPPEGDG